jgi:hypothetical protein
VFILICNCVIFETFNSKDSYTKNTGNSKIFDVDLQHCNVDDETRSIIHDIIK